MTICICGSGTMGSGIAQVAATNGFTAILYDIRQDLVEKARQRIEKDLQTLVDKKKMEAAQKEESLQRIHFTTTITDCVADVVIEAIVEKQDVKIALFGQLARINSSQTIFASNTSSLSVSVIAAAIDNPQRVAGLHFFNPAPLMKLVEVVKATQTSAEVVNTLVNLSRRMGKEPVVCLDSPGFIVNRVARPYYIESLRLAEESYADFTTIDKLLENTGFRMGPFRLMDLIGNDVNYAVSCSVHEQLGKPARLQPSFIQKEKVEKGELGKKTGKGYYNY